MINNINYRFNNNKIININECKKLLKLNIKKLIGYGGQGSVFKLMSDKCGIGVIKIFHSKTNNIDIEREIYFYNKIKKLIESDICPNYIYMHELINKNIIMEYADGDLNDFLKISPHSEDFFYNMFFQIIVGILVLQKILLTFHNDIKPKNIFFKKISIKKYKYFQYIINEQVFYIENTGYLFMIGDFGHAQSLNSNYNDLSKQDIKFAIDYNYDFIHMSSLYNRIIVDNLLLIFISLSVFLKDNDLEKDKDLKKNIENIENDININFKDYPKNVIDKMIFRAILYYCVENNIFDWRSYKNNFTIYLPSENIGKLINNIFLSKEPIEILLNKYFKKFTSIPINTEINNQENKQIKVFNIIFKSDNNFLKRENFTNIITTIKKNYNLKKINTSSIKYYYLNNSVNYLPKFIKTMYTNIDTYDYIEPIKKLFLKYNNSYYKNLIDLTDKIIFKDRLDLMSKKIIHETDLDEIMLQYVKCRSNCFVITIWPLFFPYSKDLINYLKKYGNVYYFKEIKFTFRGIINYLCSIYDEFNNNDILKIAIKKAEYIRANNSSLNDISIIIFDNINGLNISGQGSIFKKQLRNWCTDYLYKKNINMNDIQGNDLIHINDYFYQTIEYCQLILNSNSIYLLNNRIYENIYDNFYEETFLKVETFRKYLYDKIDLETMNSLIVLGGLILYFFGLRKSNDIDGICINYENNINKFKEIIDGFILENTKINFIDFGITDSKYWRDSWEELNSNVSNFFGIKNYKNICFNPRYHCYYKGIKIYLIEYEIYRKIMRINKKIGQKEINTLSKDYADFLIIYKNNKDLLKNFINILENNLIFNIKITNLYPNLKKILYNDTINNIVLKMIKNNYHSNFYNDLKKIDIQNFLYSS